MFKQTRLTQRQFFFSVFKTALIFYNFAFSFLSKGVPVFVLCIFFIWNWFSPNKIVSFMQIWHHISCKRSILPSNISHFLRRTAIKLTSSDSKPFFPGLSQMKLSLAHYRRSQMGFCNLGLSASFLQLMGTSVLINLSVNSKGHRE